MKDYFAFISKTQVTEVTTGKAGIKSLVQPGFDKPHTILLPSDKTGTEGNKHNEMLPVIRTDVDAAISLRNAETSGLPMLPDVTDHFEQFSYSYQERCGIYQHEANYSQLESEFLAYQEILKDFLEQIYPAILAEFEKIIFQPIMH